MPTAEEEKQIIRVCGPNYEESDIPTYIRNREFEKEMKLLEVLERQAEEVGEELKN